MPRGTFTYAEAVDAIRTAYCLNADEGWQVEILPDEAPAEDGWIYPPEGRDCFGACPVEPNTTVVAQWLSGHMTATCTAHLLHWDSRGDATITAYKIVKEGEA